MPNGTTQPPGNQSSPSAGSGGRAAGSAGSSPAAVGGSSAGAAGGATAGATSAGSGGAAGQTPAQATGTPTLFYLDNLGGRVLRAGADGSSAHAIVQSAGVGPDGVAVDVEHGHVFWTNMGAASADDGTVMRADLDGKNVTTIIESGGTFTPKQLTLEPTSGKLYWSDREGMRVMRADLDGSNIETLVTTGQASDRSDASRWCVGIAVDVAAGKLYWTQKGGDNAGQGSIRRANLDLPAGADPAQRSDIEVLFSELPEPIDLALDLEHHYLYWTDRGDNTVSRAPLDLPQGADPSKRSDREILVKGLGEAIGISLDLGRGKVYYTTLAGVVGAAGLDGSGAKDLLTAQGTLTGIVRVDL